MTTLSAKLTIHIPWAASLKDKRQLKRSLIDRVRLKFCVSIAEVGTQDAHRTLTLGMAVVSGSHAHARDVLDEAVRYIEANMDAELIHVEFYE